MSKISTSYRREEYQKICVITHTQWKRVRAGQLIFISQPIKRVGKEEIVRCKFICFYTVSCTHILLPWLWGLLMWYMIINQEILDGLIAINRGKTDLIHRIHAAQIKALTLSVQRAGLIKIKCIHSSKRNLGEMITCVSGGSESIFISY